MIVEQQKFAFVDALRGFAVLGVVIAHLPLPAKIQALNGAGAYGVQLFFVVSAFTLFNSVHAKFGKENRPVLNFFLRRFFRIAPAFYLALTFYLYKDGLAARFWAPDGIHWHQVLSTLSFMHGWKPDWINSVVPGGWSIAVEMTFYAFVPACYHYIRDAQRAVLASVVLLILGVLINATTRALLFSPDAGADTALTDYFFQYWFASQVCVFPFGFALYFLLRDGVLRPTIRTSTVLGIAFIAGYACIALSRSLYFGVHPQFLYGAVFAALGYAMAIKPARILVNPITCYIGKISFSLYLFHFWALELSVRYLGLPSTYLGSLVIFVVTLAASLAIATCTFYLVEQPGQRLGGRVIRKLERNAAKAA